MNTVVAAVIESEGHILACRRRPDQDHGGKWEFPGGKLEEGEKLTVALARELHEELGISAEIGPEITRYEYAYPGKEPFLLVFFTVTKWTGAIKSEHFWDVRWMPTSQLASLDFLDGDVDFVRSMASRRS